MSGEKTTETREIKPNTQEKYIKEDADGYALEDENGNCVPLAEFTQKEILAYMRIHDIPKPVIYSLALCKEGATVGKASSGVGFNIDCFKWLEDNFPGDLEKIYNVFPLSRRILFDYHGGQYQ